MAQPASAAQLPEEETLTELERRLAGLEWPEPPPGARERGLEALRPRLEELASRARDDEAA